jgi:Ca-activated chloride channel family protein
MHPRSNTLSLLRFLPILLLAVSLAAQAPAPQQQPTQAQPAQPEVTGGPDQAILEQPLRPDDLVVPSNAATEAAAAPPPAAAPTPTTTATAPAPTTGTGNTVQVPSSTGEVRQSGTGFSLRKDVEEVVLHATVVDDKQRLVTNLDKAAFTVLEDGQPREITSFRHEDVPVAVGILVDNSGSMRDKRSAVNTAALNFVRASNPQDEVFIVNFDTDAYLDSDFTSNVAKLREALEKIEAKGGTALYDAVFAASSHLEKKAKLQKRVLLVVTDGWDNASTMSLEQAVQAVQTENGPTIYTIGILDEEGRKKGKRALKEIAEQTGGVSFFPRDLTEVDSITRAVARDIRNQYIIGYKKDPNKTAGYRSVKVTAHANGYKTLQVRTRSGYFPGQETAQNK